MSKRNSFGRIVSFDFHFSYHGMECTSSLDDVNLGVGYDKTNETEPTDEESEELYERFMEFIEEHIGNLMDEFHMKSRGVLHRDPPFEREEYLGGCVTVVEKESV